MTNHTIDQAIAAVSLWVGLPEPSLLALYRALRKYLKEEDAYDKTMDVALKVMKGLRLAPAQFCTIARNARIDIDRERRTRSYTDFEEPSVELDHGSLILREFARVLRKVHPKALRIAYLRVQDQPIRVICDRVRLSRYGVVRVLARVRQCMERWDAQGSCAA